MKSVVYSSQGSQTGQLYFCNWLKVENTMGYCDQYYVPSSLMSTFLIRSAYCQVATQLSSQGWVGPVADLIHVLNCGSAGNRSRDLLVSSQIRWLLDQWSGRMTYIGTDFFVCFF